MKSYFPQIQIYQKRVRDVSLATMGIISSRKITLPTLSNALPSKGNTAFSLPQRGQAWQCQVCASFAGTCVVPAQRQSQALELQKGQMRLSLNVPVPREMQH